MLWRQKQNKQNLLNQIILYIQQQEQQIMCQAASLPQQIVLHSDIQLDTDDVKVMVQDIQVAAAANVAFPAADPQSPHNPDPDQGDDDEEEEEEEGNPALSHPDHPNFVLMVLPAPNPQLPRQNLPPPPPPQQPLPLLPPSVVSFPQKSKHSSTNWWKRGNTSQIKQMDLPMLWALIHGIQALPVKSQPFRIQMAALYKAMSQITCGLPFAAAKTSPWCCRKLFYNFTSPINQRRNQRSLWIK